MITFIVYWVCFRIVAILFVVVVTVVVAYKSLEFKMFYKECTPVLSYTASTLTSTYIDIATPNK